MVEIDLRTGLRIFLLIGKSEIENKKTSSKKRPDWITLNNKNDVLAIKSFAFSCSNANPAIPFFFFFFFTGNTIQLQNWLNSSCFRILSLIKSQCSHLGQFDFFFILNIVIGARQCQTNEKCQVNNGNHGKKNFGIFLIEKLYVDPSLHRLLHEQSCSTHWSIWKCCTDIQQRQNQSFSSQTGLQRPVCKPRGCVRRISLLQVVVKLLMAPGHTASELLEVAHHEKVWKLWITSPLTCSQALLDSLNDVAGVARCIDVGSTPNAAFLVFVDSGSMSLKEMMSSITSLEQCLKLWYGVCGRLYFLKHRFLFFFFFCVSIFRFFSFRICSVLARVHCRRMVHKDIKPGNILVHPDTLEVSLTDFGLSALYTQLDVNEQVLSGTDGATGTLQYTSPEQTGRVVLRKVDERSDLYSLGCTMFQLISGRPPFLGDARTLILSHVTRQPPKLTSLTYDVPPVVAAIVAKLLAKEPDERYQSAAGLAHDLRICIDALVDGQLPPDFTFPLASVDVPERIIKKKKKKLTMFAGLILSNAVVGRESELTRLSGAYEECRSRAVVAIVRGDAGAGKSRLIAELERVEGKKTPSSVQIQRFLWFDQTFWKLKKNLKKKIF